MNTAREAGFRLVTVVATQQISARMHRLRLAGENLIRFDTPANLHLRLHVPDVPQKAMAARVGGREDITRYYTIRRIDAERGWIDVDFVLHEAAGPACDFARRARVGDVCGISGPCGLGVKPARDYLLAGDETALPAIARILETLPREARGTVLIETLDADGVCDLARPDGIDLCWFCRHQRGHDDFIAATEKAISTLAGKAEDHFIWIAGEFSDCEALRPALKVTQKRRYINVAYWRATEAVR